MTSPSAGLPEPTADTVAVVTRAIERQPALVKWLVTGLGFLLAAMGAQILWPGTRVTRLEAKDVTQDAAAIIANGRVDSLATVLRSHLTDEGITRRATQIYLCLNSEPAEQDMLQLPCTALIQNASRSPRRPRR